jgi:hypothetical protein
MLEAGYRCAVRRGLLGEDRPLNSGYDRSLKLKRRAGPDWLRVLLPAMGLFKRTVRLPNAATRSGWHRPL